MSGVEKHIDELGRIVLPIKYRQKLGLRSGSKVEVSLNENIINIKPVDCVCAICGDFGPINAEVRICFNCIERIKKI